MSKRAALIADAKAAGYDVIADGTTLRIVRMDRRSKGRPLRGIVLYETGTAFDATVDLSVARGMRSYADMRKVLGI
jgi:hypothetical protein